MSQEHFDDLTRALATGEFSRGRMLRLAGGALLGSVLGGWGMFLGANDAEAKRRRRRRRSLSSNKPLLCTVGTNEGCEACEGCAPLWDDIFGRASYGTCEEDCPEGFTCNSDKTGCCNSADTCCKGRGQACSNDNECCFATRKCVNGVCTFVPTTSPPTSPPGTVCDGKQCRSCERLDTATCQCEIIDCSCNTNNTHTCTWPDGTFTCCAEPCICCPSGSGCSKRACDPRTGYCAPDGCCTTL